MKRYIHFIQTTTALVLTLFTTLNAAAQVEDATDTESLLAQIDALTKRVESIEAQNSAAKSATFYTPNVYGSMLAYFNVNTYDGAQRFAVRNAHVGVRGNASNALSYCTQVNFHNLGKVSVLDAYMRYKGGKFDLTIGQQWTHLTTDLDRTGPKSSIFTSRSYGAIYSLAYTDGSTVKNFGNRDIGLYGNYRLGTTLPVTLSLGLFNGAGANSVEWDDDINITGRLQIGASKGLSGGVSIYSGTTAYDQDVTIWSGEARWVGEALFVEANYQQKSVDIVGLGEMTRTLLVESYYTIKAPKSKIFDSYVPALRYDYGEGMLFTNASSDEPESLDAGRITAQMGFMLKGAKIRSRLSLSYEKCFMDERPTDYAENPLFQDRVTAAVTVAF